MNIHLKINNNLFLLFSNIYFKHQILNYETEASLLYFNILYFNKLQNIYYWNNSKLIYLKFYFA